MFYQIKHFTFNVGITCPEEGECGSMLVIYQLSLKNYLYCYIIVVTVGFLSGVS